MPQILGNGLGILGDELLIPLSDQRPGGMLDFLPLLLNHRGYVRSQRLNLFRSKFFHQVGVLPTDEIG